MPTIKEVAELAGVSIGTVSHVISGAVPVSSVLRRKVVKAVRTLDYHPNHIARSLKTSRTRTIGIVVPDMTIPFFPCVIRGAEAAASGEGYSLIAVNSDDNSSRQGAVLSLLRSQRVEGILLVVAAGRGSIAQIQQAIDSGTPVVCLDRLPGRLLIDSVCVDDYGAADLGVSHLIAQGHRQIAILTGPRMLRNEKERLNGYKNALARAGLPVNGRLVWESPFRQEDVIRICRERLQDARHRPDAVFSTNGVIGLGVLRGLSSCGLNTPGDIAFATFDELTVEGAFRPAITTVVQPAYEIGHQATQILLRRIRGVAGEDPVAAVRLPAELKIRESCARLPRAGT